MLRGLGGLIWEALRKDRAGPKIRCQRGPEEVLGLGGLHS